MEEHSRLDSDPERGVRADEIRQRMESVAEQAVHIGTTLKEILDTTREQARPDYRWHEPATMMAIKAQQVRSVIKSRRLRESVFGGGLFGDPAWDMLLDLYGAHLEQKRISVSSLQIASAVPGTTALRWMTRLEDKGLVMRHADPFDARRIFVALSEEGLELMEHFWSRLWSLGPD